MEAACGEVAVCSVSVLCVSPEACVEVEESASGACTGDLRAFAGLAVCACVAWWREREAFPLAPAPFAARVLPGKACAATSENTPVSVTEPASSQRLQRDSRRRAASRE